METKIGVQVLVTAHNAEKYICSSLNSILPAVEGRPWVFIFHDDGSTDDTSNIAEGSGALTYAAAYKDRLKNKNLNVAIILTGSNIDRAKYSKIIS